MAGGFQVFRKSYKLGNKSFDASDEFDEMGVRNVYKVIKTTKLEGNTDDENSIIRNIRNDSTLNLSSSKKDTLCWVASAMLDKKFEPEFIAGVLGNIMAEGTYGEFEKSNYTTNPSLKPDYLKYMDNNYNYSNDYSGKNISKVGLKKTWGLIIKLEKDKYLKGKFGLGSVQWTGERTKVLLKKYIEVCIDIDSYPTKEQMLQAESMCILEELNGSHRWVYNKWIKECKDKNKSVYNAGDYVARKYEVPKNIETKAPQRANYSEEIYRVMMKK